MTGLLGEASEAPAKRLANPVIIGDERRPVVAGKRG